MSIRKRYVLSWSPKDSLPRAWPVELTSQQATKLRERMAEANALLFDGCWNLEPVTGVLTYTESLEVIHNISFHFTN